MYVTGVITMAVSTLVWGASLIPLQLLDPLTAQVPLPAAILVLWLAFDRVRRGGKADRSSE